MPSALQLRALLCGAVALAVAGCGGGGSRNVTVSGKAPTAVASLAALRVTGSGAAAVAAPRPDTIEAFPIETGLILSNGLGGMRTATIAADGSFTITLTSDSDWMLMLVDSAATGPARYLGYVGATVTTGNVLLALPTSAATGDIALGTLLPTSGDASTVAGDPVPASFALDQATLLALARTNAAFKYLRNLLVNRQGAIYAMATPQFGFRLASATPIPAGAFVDPAGYLMQPEWGLQFDSNDPRAAPDLLCGNAPPLLALQAPGGGTLDSAGTTCSGTAPVRSLNGPHFFGVEKSDPGPYGSRMAFNFLPKPTGAVAAGTWTVTSNGSPVGLFDVAIAAPADGSGRPTGPTPSLRAVTDPVSHRVTRIDVRWYVPDGAGGFAEVVDPAYFSHVIRHVEVKLGGPGGRWEGMVLDPATQGSVAPAQAWYVGGGAPAQHADEALVYLGNAGVGRFFGVTFE